MIDYQYVEDVDLATHINRLALEEASRREERQRLEFELQKRLEARGAKELAHPELEVKLDIPSPTYDYGKLRRLAELVPPDVLLTGYSPEHQETQVVMVKEKWNMVKVKPWVKYGNEVAEVIEGAKMPGGPARLKIRSRAKKN